MVNPVNSYGNYSFGGGNQIQDAFNAMNSQTEDFLNALQANDPKITAKMEQIGGMYYLYEEIKTTLSKVSGISSNLVGNYDQASDMFHNSYTAFQAALKSGKGVQSAISAMGSAFEKLVSAMNPITSYFNSKPSSFNQLMEDQITYKLSYSDPTKLHIVNGRNDELSMNHLEGYVMIFKTLAQCEALPPKFSSLYNNSFESSYDQYLSDPANKSAFNHLISLLNQMKAALS